MTIRETQDIAACHALRRAVFMDEQGISEADEFDDLDAKARHFLAMQGGRPVGTARMIPAGETLKIGRVCVLAKARGTGLGAALVQAGVDLARREGYKRAYLSAQTYALGFYEGLGFRPYGGIYDDAGIPHQDMDILL